jgi:NRPS condensation-like uncharacterized protein
MSSVKKPFLWFKLDNAAKIFPSVINSRTTEVFRLSATLKTDVNPEILQAALDKVIERFPYYKTYLRWGFFWHYLQYNPQRPLVLKETNAPCRKIDTKENRGYLFRVLYYKQRISFECSHILTDGTGALTFLRSLVTQYFVESGVSIKDMGDVISYDKPPHAEEFEDAYKRYYKKDIPPPVKKEKAFHVPSKLIDQNDHKIVTGIVTLKKILKLAREKNVTITELLSSVYIHALNSFAQDLPWNMKKKHLRPIRLMVPVNLRKLYPSRTMRNFFLTVNPGIDPRLGHYTLDDIVKEVYHYMRVEVDEKFINQQITRNVRGEIHPAVRMIPLPLKVLIERMLYSFVATSRQSGVLTNMGAAELPPEAAKRVERFEFIANPNKDTKINCGVISFQDKLYISFGSLAESTDVQMYFFRTLRKLGLDVKIETN